MHVIMTIAGGIVMLGLFLLFGKLWGTSATGLLLAARCFVPVWLAMSVANLWVGVRVAGYALREELPILALVFVVPAGLAALAIWHWSR
jgi:hypothetical protein